MKQIKELEVIYGGKNIVKLIEVIQELPLELSEGNYYIEQKDNTIHIYSTERISEYNLNASVTGIKQSEKGIEIKTAFKGLEKIILHSDKPSNELVNKISNHFITSSYNSGESRCSHNYGESNCGGESN